MSERGQLINGGTVPIYVKTIKPEALSAAEKAAWLGLRANNPALYSPYFHPDYTLGVGKLRDDAFIAIAYENDHPIAFFPYQGPHPGKSGFARPIGAPMTDYHGMVAAEDCSLLFEDLLFETGIGAFHYGALISSDPEFRGQLSSVVDATMMDVSAGVSAWREQRDSSYRRSLKSHRRRVRKAEEEFGTRRFVFKSQDRAVFDTLIEWKVRQYEETGKYDVLSSKWTLDLLQSLWTSSDDLHCDMHALYFGDRLAAIDLGLSDGPTFHSWIVAYDSELHSLAPGIQLLEALIDASQDLNYQRIDLGVGTEGYKRHYASEPVTVQSGFIPVKGPAAALSRVYDHTETLGKKVLKDVPGKLRRRYSQIAACDETFAGRAKAMLSAIKSSGQG